MRDRRSVAIVGSAAVVGGLVAAVLWWAVLPTPRFVAFVPGGDGYIAHHLDTADELPLVAITALADGSRVVIAIPEQATMLGFEGGRLVLADPVMRQRILIDPATGDQEVEAAADEDLWGVPEISTHWQTADGLVVIARDDVDGAVSFPAPDTYLVSSAVALGDDRVAFTDPFGRVAVGTIGGGTPMQVADDAPRWSMVVATANVAD